MCHALRDPIFRLALRYFSHPSEVEDSTQDILIQMITHLGSFEGRSKWTTWVYRIASRHLLSTKRRGDEPTVHSGAEIAGYLDGSPAPTPRRAVAPAWRGGGMGGKFAGTAAPPSSDREATCQHQLPIG